MTSADEVRRSSRRIGLYTAALVAGAMLVVGTFVFTGFERSITSHGIEQMRATVANIDDADEAPPGVLLYVIKEKSGKREASAGMPVGLPYRPDLQATTKDRQMREHEVTLKSGERYIVRTQATKKKVMQAMYSLSDTREDIRALREVLIVGGLLGVLISALIGFALARRTIAPMAETVDLQRRFVADASHELRTPLTLLSTRVQLLARRLRGTDNAAVATELDGVVGDANRLADILDDLLVAADPRDLAAVESVDVRALADGVVDSVTAAAGARGISVALTGDAGAAAMVKGAPVSLRRAVLALVDNALEHAASQVDVRVTGGKKCRVDVSDDGPGFDDAELPRVFERFTSHRAQSEARRHYGLGLALVADVAHAHGGTVEASRSQLGGALVSLVLPAGKA